MERILRISGRVQGVGFRYWVIRQAAGIGNISGYALNLADGDVLVLMRGQEADLDRLQSALYKGPLWARVDSVKEEPESKTYFPPLQEGKFRRI